MRYIDFLNTYIVYASKVLYCVSTIQCAAFTPLATQSHPDMHLR